MEILVLAEDRVGRTPEIDLKSTYKKGYPVNALSDGHPWHRKERLPMFVVVKCPEVTVAQAKTYETMWMKRIDYEVLSINPNNATYQIRVFGENVSASGKNILTKDQVENYLENWDCVIEGFAANEVILTLSLWQSCKSNGFWECDVSLVGFTLISYDSQTGNAMVEANYEILNVNEKNIIARIKTRGGNIISLKNEVVRFEINRDDVLQHFKEETKERVETIYSRRMFRFDPNFIDTVIAAGGQLAVSKAELLANLINRLDE